MFQAKQSGGFGLHGLNQQRRKIAMESNEKRRPRGSGSIYQQPGSRFLWIAYRDANGKLVRESAGSEKATDAQKLLRDRMGKADAGNSVTSEVRRITVEKLYDALLVEYKK